MAAVGKENMKIVISGGWGYGNLGDDAILDSTIRQLQVRFPGCDCVVLTYDTADSAVHASQRVRLAHGVHRITDGGGCELFKPSMAKDYGLIKNAFRKARFALTETSAWFANAVGSKELIQLREEIASASLYVMGGGGYFNEKWLNKTRAQLLEMRIAADCGVPVLILGPTVGTFHGSIQGEIASAFQRARLVSVRDEASYAIVKEWKSDTVMMPDVALGNWLEDAPPKEGLGIVFTTAHTALRQCLANAVQQFTRSFDARISVKLFITRRWKYDLKSAILLQEELQRRGVGCNLIMPSNFHDLERELASCQMLISENLHGLILAARNLVPVVAVNDYAPGSPNFKKFVAFLKQSDSEKLYINSQTAEADVVSMLKCLYAHRDEKQVDLMKLRQQVADEYARELGSVMVPALTP